MTVISLITMCGLRTDDPCWMKGYLPDYLYFECPASKNDFLVDFISNQVRFTLPFPGMQVDPSGCSLGFDEL